jgi:hypothetical protein
METLEFYVVRSKDGKFLRSKGYSGSGNSWVTELSKAKVYTKKGPASAQITFWATNYPQYGIPDLIPLTATLGEPIDQTERVQKSIRKKEIDKAKQDLYRAEDEFDRAKRELERINSGYAQKNLNKAMSELLKQKNKIKELSTK